MKPFDPELALIGAKVITKENGTEVTQLTRFELGTPGGFCWAGVHDGEVNTWTNEGKYLEDGDSGMDLCMAPKIVTKYSFLLPSRFVCSFFDSPEELLSSAIVNGGLPEKAKLVKIEWEEE